MPRRTKNAWAVKAGLFDDGGVVAMFEVTPIMPKELHRSSHKILMGGFEQIAQH